MNINLDMFSPRSDPKHSDLIVLNIVLFQSGGFSKDPACGNTKSCYGDCSDDGVCTLLSTWQVTGNKLTISLHSVTSSEDYWVAIGFSTKPSMVGVLSPCLTIRALRD